MKNLLLLSCASLLAFACVAARANDYLLLDLANPVPVSTGVVASGKRMAFAVVRGDSLHTTLDTWAKLAGWQPVIWKLADGTDFTLGASHTFTGDFPTAIKDLTEALNPDGGLRFRLNHANRVILVEPSL